MFNKTTALMVAAAVFVGMGVFIWVQGDGAPEVSNYQECVDAGYPVMESYPTQCRTPDGETFTQDIGNELEKADLIRVDSPRPNNTVESPVSISGEARGAWYFEADFPVRALDENGEEIGATSAQAQDSWMTEDFVPFQATLTLDEEYEGLGTIVFERANPSGMEQNADSLVMPVRFESGADSSDESVSSEGDCVVSGCSSEVCASEPVASPCIYKPEFACYRNATCERQQDGSCGWTQTDRLTSCIQEAQNDQP